MSFSRRARLSPSMESLQSMDFEPVLSGSRSRSTSVTGISPFDEGGPLEENSRARRTSISMGDFLTPVAPGGATLSNRDGQSSHRRRKSSVDRSRRQSGGSKRSSRSQSRGPTRKDGEPDIAPMVAGSSLKYLMKNLPASASITHVDTAHTPFIKTGSLQDFTEVDQSRTHHSPMCDVFFDDFFVAKISEKLNKTRTLFLYIYTPVISQELKEHIDVFDRYSPNGGLRKCMNMLNQQQYLRRYGECEKRFLKEQQGIHEELSDQDVTRVAFQVTDGKLDEGSRRFLRQYPIMSFPMDKEWPLLRLFFWHGSGLKQPVFLKKGPLGDAEMKAIKREHEPIATAIAFLDGDENHGRTAQLAAENFGLLRINMIKKKVLPDNTEVCSYYGKLSLRLATNKASGPRTPMFKGTAMSKIMMQEMLLSNDTQGSDVPRRAEMNSTRGGEWPILPEMVGPRPAWMANPWAY